MKRITTLSLAVVAGLFLISPVRADEPKNHDKDVVYDEAKVPPYDLPVDQHMLLACIAPRPVYVHSGVEDTWADARGEYLSAYHASEVYRLLGKKGLTTEASPAVGEAIVNSDVGYHNRPGGHSMEMYDWLKFLEFAEHHIKR